jgi:hypothetical protein
LSGYDGRDPGSRIEALTHRSAPVDLEPGSFPVVGRVDTPSIRDRIDDVQTAPIGVVAGGGRRRQGCAEIVHADLGVACRQVDGNLEGQPCVQDGVCHQLAADEEDDVGIRTVVAACEAVSEEVSGRFGALGDGLETRLLHAMTPEPVCVGRWYENLTGVRYPPDDSNTQGLVWCGLGIILR